MLNPVADNRTARVPLIGAETPESPVAWRRGAAIDRDTFMSDVRRLAKRLPDGGEAVNYCTDRYHFVVALAAAALRGHTTHLPHDRTSHSLHSIAAERGTLYCLLDSENRPQGVPCIRVDGIRADLPSETGVASLPRDQMVATVYTGGTTGEPRPNAKSWEALTDGAWRIAAALRFDEHPDASVIATVPPQHMFGLELSVMVPLCRAMPFHAEKPFYPADIERAVAEAPGPTVLITTPVHLKALATAKPVLSGLVKVVSATAPLSVALAERVESLYGAPVLEIYGCTEAGSIASRRTVAGAPWRALQGIAVVNGDAGCRAMVPYLPEAVLLHDVVEPLSETDFWLGGRSSEMVNLAGKRASLAGLNAILNDIDGVADGVFIVPPENAGESVTRLAAVVVAPGLNEAAIRQALRDAIDPVFMPRPLILLEELPRSEAGKLNAATLERLVRRVTGNKA